MAQIFEEAAAEIRSSTPSRRISANTTRSRCPLPFGNSVRGADGDNRHEDGGSPYSRSSACASTPPDVPFEQTFPTPLPFYSTSNHPTPIDNMAKEPLSSGFTSPVKPPSRSSNGRLMLPQSLTPDPQDDDCHSTHGVPLVLPVRGAGKDTVNNYHVDSWLDKVLELSPPHTNHPAFKESTNQTIGTPRLLVAGGSPWGRTSAKLDRSPDTPYSKLSLSRLVSNKENIPPSKAAKTWSNVASPLAGTIGHQSMTPVNPQASDQSSSNISDSSSGLARPGYTSLSPMPCPPQGLLHLSPKRKKAKVAELIKQKHKVPGSSSFTICEDESADVLAELSPVIERHRKGRGPKRGRCPSYYDQDILPQFSPSNDKGVKKDGKEEVKIRKGRKVLRDTKNSAELTRAKAFDEVAENAEFEFEISID
ncbi:MAG: hypothetical protein Q9187_002795 [Circinaria calcarea]